MEVESAQTSLKIGFYEHSLERLHFPDMGYSNNDNKLGSYVLEGYQRLCQLLSSFKM